jgi:DNA polymerase-4
VQDFVPLPRPRTRASILHADLDAFYASVEQIDKPSLRGKPVIVGGTGSRGVVATASYEARAFGVHSAMSTVEARARCPKAAFLVPRFEAYRAFSGIVMALLRELSPLVEPLSLDEAYVDLEAGDHDDLSDDAVRILAAALKEKVHAATGLTVSVGAGSSKLVAKIASDLDKPDGLLVVPAGQESTVLRSLAVTRLPGVGPATATRLRSIGVTTIADLADLPESDVVGALGKTHGRGLWLLAHGLDDRAVIAERESKSVSVEDTFDTDIADTARLAMIVDAMSRRVMERLRQARLSGRTISVKVRLHDFTTLTRSATLPDPTDDARAVNRLARQLLSDVDVSGGVRLLGVGVSGLADWTQDDLFGDSSADDEHAGVDDEPPPDGDELPGAEVTPPTDDASGSAEPRRSPVRENSYPPGHDVVHEVFGAGWVHGSGSGWVTVRFETRDTPVGKVRSFRIGDPSLAPAPPNSVPAASASVPTMELAAAHTIEVETDDGSLPLYEARPEAPRAAVVVVQEAFGVTGHIADVARRLGTAGYHAVAPDLYHRDDVKEVPYDRVDLAKEHMGRLTAEGLRTDLDATLKYLADQGFSPAETGIVGFCMGGSVVMVAASEHAFGAAVTFYGGGVLTGRFGFPPLVAVAPDLRSPWLGLFGDRDESIPPEQVELLRGEAAKSAVPTSIVRYPEAGHGFHCDARPQNYDEAAAHDGWAKTLDWFGRYLAPRS